eukprot:357720_1
MTPNENEMQTTSNSVVPQINDNLYNKWKCDGLNKMKEKARYNVHHRSNKIKHVVNDIVRGLTGNQCYPFTINDEFEEVALNKLFTKFEEWTGVNINACKNGIVDWSEYWDRADNWLNRNKGQWFGDYYFYPIFNTHLKQYCQDVADSNYPHHTRKRQCFYSLIYAEILKRVSSENIRFKQTRPQSLVIDQSLIQSNLLQTFSIKFAASNGAIWTLPKTKSAKLYRESLRECMDDIYKRIESAYCMVFKPEYGSKNHENNNIQMTLPTKTRPVIKPPVMPMHYTYLNAPIPLVPPVSQPVTYYVVPVNNYGAMHQNTASYVMNQRYHPFSTTDRNHNSHNDYGWLINAVLAGNHMINPFGYI